MRFGPYDVGKKHYIKRKEELTSEEITLEKQPHNIKAQHQTSESLKHVIVQKFLKDRTL